MSLVNLKEIKTNIDDNNLTQVNLFFNKYNYDDICDKMKNGFISLKIRYLININKFYEVLYILKNFKLMKRDYILIVIYFYNIDTLLSIDIFNNYILNKHKLESTDIDKLIENKCFNIIKLLDSYFVLCSYKTNIDINNIEISEYNNLYKYTIDMNIKQKIFIFYKDKLKDNYFNSLISKIHDIDCIVDGGNISHMNGGNCDYKYIDKISNSINKNYKNPLYIFHNRHKDKLKEFLKSINHFITPINEYDDYYILISMILSNKPVITNDNFKDHIFDMLKNFETVDLKIKNYINENIINYNKNKINKEIKYSKCIQVIKNNIYIPTKNGMYKLLMN